MLAIVPPWLNGVILLPRRSSQELAGGDPNVKPKAMTVRLDPEQAAELEAVAEVEGVPVAEAIRNAIAEHIEARRRDEAFQARLRASLERNRQILEKLAR